MNEQTTMPTSAANAIGAVDLLNALAAVIDTKTVALQQPLVLPETGAPLVVKAILGVMRRIQEVPKFGRNKVDGYDYVRAADLLALVQTALVQERLIIAQREMRKVIKGRVAMITYQYDAWHESGQGILNIASNTGACRFEFKSGTTDDKSLGKAQTAGLKSQIISLFKIPSDVDPDIERDDLGSPDVESRDTERGDRPPPPVNPAQPPPADRPRGSTWDPPEVPASGSRRDDPGVARDAESSREPRREEPPPPDYDDYGGAPPEDPPFGEPGRPAPAASSPEERDFRQNVEGLSRSLRGAPTEDDAARIWTENADIIRNMTDNTYEFFRQNYYGRWNVVPPRT